MLIYWQQSRFRTKLTVLHRQIPVAIARLRDSLEVGGIAVLARITATGESIGAGICSVPNNQTTEIAGIGVRAAFRRRGVAGALTARLVQEAFNAGVCVPFLMAAHEAEERIYARAGFSVVGEILHISLSNNRDHNADRANTITSVR